MHRSTIAREWAEGGGTEGAAQGVHFDARPEFSDEEHLSHGPRSGSGVQLCAALGHQMEINNQLQTVLQQQQHGDIKVIGTTIADQIAQVMKAPQPRNEVIGTPAFTGDEEKFR